MSSFMLRRANGHHAIGAPARDLHNVVADQPAVPFAHSPAMNTVDIPGGAWDTTVLTALVSGIVLMSSAG
jgi:hypothetical protein